MDFSELAFRILVLLTPGSLYMKVFRTLQATKEKKDWEDYFEIIFVSIICYLLYSLIQSVHFGFNPLIVSFEYNEAISLGILSNLIFEINLKEVFYSTVIGIFIAFISSFLKRMNLLNIIGQVLRVTNRYGSEDLWSRFNCIDKIEWVTVRDYKSGLDYYGYIKYYSDLDERREIIMENVTIFKDGTHIEYNVDKLYISREFDDLSIEYTDLNGKGKVIENG